MYNLHRVGVSPFIALFDFLLRRQADIVVSMRLVRLEHRGENGKEAALQLLEV